MYLKLPVEQLEDSVDAIVSKGLQVYGKILVIAVYRRFILNGTKIASGKF